MSVGSTGSHRPANVKAGKMLERKQLEAETFSLDAQLRRFDRLRERLVACGRDPSESYRALEERRGKVAAALKQSRATLPPPNDLDSQPLLIRPSEPLLSRSVAPARFDPTTGTFGLGTSGVVQAGPASENTNVVAQGKYDPSGEIETIPGAYPGAIWYSGHLTVGPESIPVDEYDPTINYFWIHSWKTLIPFPPPASRSRLTYRFDPWAFLSVQAGGDAFVWCFASVGETANLSQGTDVTVNIDAGWPLMADLSQPGPQYNGSYGSFDGQTTVQRSFMVGAAHVPGVAVVLGVIVGTSMMEDVRLFLPGLGYSSVGIRHADRGGQVAYTYEPEWVLEQ